MWSAICFIILPPPHGVISPAVHSCPSLCISCLIHFFLSLNVFSFLPSILSYFHWWMHPAVCVRVWVCVRRCLSLNWTGEIARVWGRVRGNDPEIIQTPLMFHWCSVYWPLLWFLSSSPPLPTSFLPSSAPPITHLFLFSICPYTLKCCTPLFKTLPSPRVRVSFTSFSFSLHSLIRPNLTLGLPFLPPPQIPLCLPSFLNPSSSWKPPPPPSSNAGRSDLYLRLSSSSSAPPLPVLCSAVSLSKDGHASKSLYPLRYVQPLLFYLYISLC